LKKKDELQPPTIGAVTVTVNGCARCGGTHEALAFRPFRRPPFAIESTISHFAACPSTEEPILLSVKEAE